MAKPVIYKDNSKTQNFLESLQIAILNRVRRPYGGNEPVVYEFTQDRGLIYQYHTLLETMYRRMYDADNFKADEDVYDKLSYLLIARRGRLCLGGCRLTIREHDEMWSLPMESNDFKLRELFPHLPLNKRRHGEISRFAIMEDSGDRDIFYSLSKVMYDKVINSNIHYLFAKSTLPLARNWRLIANNFGVKTAKICTDLKVPDHPSIRDEKWYITLSDLSNLCKEEPILEPAVQNVMAEKPSLALID